MTSPRRYQGCVSGATGCDSQVVPEPIAMSDQHPQIALTSPALAILGFRHGFFSRLGGVSDPPFATLSFSSSVGDSTDAVAENLRRAGAFLEVPGDRIYFLSQVHGVDAHVVEASTSQEEVWRLEGDVTLSRAPGLACGIRMADCTPILIADEASGAVVAIHSGWRGTVQNVAQAGIDALRHLIGNNGRLTAAVGPHIERCCFEVGDGVAAQIATASPLPTPTIVDRSRTKPHLDLRAIIERQLQDAGVATIDHVRGCTVCDSEKYHSYRRDGVRSGRMLAAIVPRTRG